MTPRSVASGFRLGTLPQLAIPAGLPLVATAVALVPVVEAVATALVPASVAVAVATAVALVPVSAPVAVATAVALVPASAPVLVSNRIQVPLVPAVSPAADLVVEREKESDRRAQSTQVAFG